jgi:sugar phosphate isomerase/epimerase
MNKLMLAQTTLPDTAPIEYIAAAVEAGYDGIGLRLNRSPGLPFHPVVGNAALIAEIKRRLGESGLPVNEILSFYLQPEIDIGQFTAALELGAELGAKYAMVIGDDPEWARMRDNFGRLCDAAAQFGLTAIVEFVPRRALANLQQTLRLLLETARPNVAICIDPLHFARSGAVPADLKKLDTRLFPYLQICDGVLGPGEPDPDGLGRIAVEERLMPGEGTLPLRDILGALPAGLPISVEVPLRKEAQVSARAWAKLTAEKTRRFLADLGQSGASR